MRELKEVLEVRTIKGLGPWILKEIVEEVYDSNSIQYTWVKLSIRKSLQFKVKKIIKAAAYTSEGYIALVMPNQLTCLPFAVKYKLVHLFALKNFIRKLTMVWKER
jgi:hypothetical protein